MYKGKLVILATKHQKEKVIGPVFEAELGCLVHVPTDYDTDQFGTFSGEIPRKLSQYETLIQKGKVAAERFGYQYALASEGSFGAHPTLYLVPGNIELMTFIDISADLVITEMEVTTATNYCYVDVGAHEDFAAYLAKAKFPSHALIVRSLGDENNYLKKAIRCSHELHLALNEAFKYSHTVRIETDMRAMLNPTRMQVIQQLAKKLAKRIQEQCPKCGTPGFGKISMEGHLACKMCGMETSLYKHKILSCLKCDYKKSEPLDETQFADPRHCLHCNP